MADDVSINIGINPTQAEKGSKTARAAVGNVAKETKELEGAFKRLKTALDPTFAAQQKYNRLLEDNKKLLEAGIIKKREYNANLKESKRWLDEQTAAIQKNTAAGKAAQEAERAGRAAALAAERQAKAEQRQESRRLAQEEMAAAKAAAAEVRAAKKAERDAIKAAATEAKAAAREKVAAERAAAAEEAAAIKEAKAAERAALRQAAEEAKKAAAEKRAASRAESAAAAEAAAATKAANKAAAVAAKEASDAATRHAKAEKAAANAVHELRQSIDPAYAAQSRYNATMQTATQLLLQGKLRQGEWNAIQRQAKTQMEINTRTLGRMNTAYTGLGYQVQDVFAQLSTNTNPFVILSQQGSQAAMALSTVGGRIGSIATFISGPLGASILGLIALIGLFATKQSEAKKKTLDLTDSMERQKATIEALSKALVEYAQRRREANQTDEESARVELARSRTYARETEQRLRDLEQDLARWQQKLDAFNRNGDTTSFGASVASTKVKQLTQAVKEARKAFDAAQAAVTENLFNVDDRNAEALVDPMKRVTQEYNKAVIELNQRYRTQMGMISQIGNLQARKLAMDGLEIARQTELVELMKKKKAAEEEVNAAKQEDRFNSKRETASFMMPVSGPVTSGVGHRDSPGGIGSTNHKGIDIAAPRGTAVQAPQVGVVEAVGYSSTLGKYVVLNHGGGTTTRFGHLSDNSMVTKGQQISQGQTIGKVGSTGNSTGNHLHYEVRVNGRPVDPRKGIFPIDTLKAEQSGLKDLSKAAEEVLRDRVEAMDTKVSAAEAEGDYATAMEWQNKKITALKQFYGVQSREAERAAQELIAIEKRKWAADIALQKEAIQTKLKNAEDAENERMELAGQRRETKSGNVDFQENNGLISAKEAMRQRAVILDEEFRGQIEHENRMFQLKLQAFQETLKLEHLMPVERAKILQQVEQLEVQHQSQMRIMQGQQQQRTIQLQQQTLQLTINKWRGMFDTIRTSMGASIQGMLNRTMTWKQAMLGVADSILYRFIDMGLQMAQDWAMREIFKTGATTAGEAARTSAATAGAATRAGVSSAASMTELTNEAAVSAAGAYKSTVVIPFIGPVAAPAAAALALAAVLGFGSMISAKGGAGTIERDGQLAELHKEEMVLPAYLANPMRDMLTGVGPRRSGLSGGVARSAAEAGGLAGMMGGDAHVHLTAIDTRSGLEFLMKNRRGIAKALQKTAREGMNKG